MKLKTHRKDNPGQPVVSSVDCHTSSISKCVDYTLQPIVKDIPSCVWDTKNFLTKLNHVRQRQKVSLLVLLNVKSFHTNIHNNEGIKAVPEAYDKHPSKAVSTKVIITFLSLILTLNNFILTFLTIYNYGMCNGHNLCSNIC